MLRAEREVVVTAKRSAVKKYRRWVERSGSLNEGGQRAGSIRRSASKNKSDCSRSL